MSNKKGLFSRLFGGKSNEPPQKPKPAPVSKFKGASPPVVLPAVAEKSIAGTRLIISRLPAYDPAKDFQYGYFSTEEKEIIKTVTQVVADLQGFHMLTETGEHVYEIAYTGIDRILYLERAVPVHFIRVGGDYRTRIPLPSWTNKFNEELIAFIVERAGLMEKKSSQSFRDETVEVSYYGRKS